MNARTDYGVFLSPESFIGGQVRAAERPARRRVGGLGPRPEVDAWVMRTAASTGFGAPEAALAIGAESGAGGHVG